MTFPSDPMIGLAGYLDQARADYLTSLTETWFITMGRMPSELQEDLQLCRRWFDPVAQGQRLRKELAQLDGFPIGLNNPEIRSLSVSARRSGS